MKLHSHLLPMILQAEAEVTRMLKKNVGGAGLCDFIDMDMVRAIGEDIREAVAFDCRRLPSDFVSHTGHECGQEIIAGMPTPKLPFPNCFFEFDRFGVAAHELGEGDKEELDYEIGFHVIPLPCSENQLAAAMHYGGELWNGETWQGDKFVDDRFNTFKRYGFDVEYYGDLESEEPLALPRLGGEALLGTLALMQESLLSSLTVMDKVNQEQSRKLAKAGVRLVPREYRVLTLNMAQARTAARRVSFGSHESPRLHWRRGHWRTLHRLSEFERRTWIKRCLVGDPDKGFVAKHYSLIYESRIH